MDDEPYTAPDDAIVAGPAQELSTSVLVPVPLADTMEQLTSSS